MVRFMESYRSQLQMRIWSSGMNCLDEHSPSCVIKAGLCHLLPYHPVPTTDEIIILFCKCLFICLFFTLENQEFLFLLFFSFFFFEELEEESVLYLIYDSISLCITAVSQGRNSHRTGAWRQELEQRPQKSIVTGCFPCLPQPAF